MKEPGRGRIMNKPLFAVAVAVAAVASAVYSYCGILVLVLSFLDTV